MLVLGIVNTINFSPIAFFNEDMPFFACWTRDTSALFSCSKPEICLTKTIKAEQNQHLQLVVCGDSMTG